MTVGELVYKQALEANQSLAYTKGLIPNEAFKSIQDLSETFERPMKMMAEAFKTIQPQLKVMEEMNLPEKLRQITEPIAGVSLSDFAKHYNEAITAHPWYLEPEEDFLIPHYTQPVQEVRVVNVEEIAGTKANRKDDYPVGSYPLPQNAVWESLGIQFIDGHFVKVSYVGMKSKKFDYKDMGFINTKNMKPDFKWALLRTIADNGGALTKSKFNPKFGRNVKYELNEGLKSFFNMKSNPIPRYTRGRGYRPLFTLRSDK